MSKNDEEDFFGFDTKLPVSLKGPQQSFGDVELEDTYDALNDETFGIMTTDGDWEVEHEKLAEQLKFDPDEKPSYNYADDYEEESAYPGPEPVNLKNARISSTGNVRIERDSEDAASVAARISEMLLDDDDLDSLLAKPYPKTIDPQLLDAKATSPTPLYENDMASATSIWSAVPSAELSGVPALPVKPELYNVHLPGLPTRLPTGLSTGLPAGLPPGMPILPQANFKTVEELERDLLKAQQQQAPPLHPQPLTLEELERNILSLNQHNIPNSPYAPNAAQPPHPLNMMLLPPSHPIPTPAMLLNLPPPNQPLMMPPIAGIMPLPALSHDARLAHAPNQVNDRGRHHVDSGKSRTGDEYAGLMSTKEKQWLISIQINQLISDNPFVEDYYFTMLRLKCLDSMQQKSEKSTCSRHIIPEKSKIEAKTYSPAQFENSLGKLQVVTYTAPRKIIDVNISQPMADTQDQSRKLKQILLDIEKLFGWLLNIEDAEMRADSTHDLSIQSHYRQLTEENLQKLQSFLQSSDKISQVLLVRKGKVFLLRAWRRLRLSTQEMIVKSLFLNCVALVRRDAQDHMLVRFLPLVNDVLASLRDMEALLRFSSCFDSSRSTNVQAVISTKTGIDFISLIMCRGAELLPACNNPSVRCNWLSFVTATHREIMLMVELKKPVKSNLGLLQAQLFVQAGLDKSVVDKAKLIVE